VSGLAAALAGPVLGAAGETISWTPITDNILALFV